MANLDPGPVLGPGDLLALDPGEITTGWVVYRPDPGPGPGLGGLVLLSAGWTANQGLRWSLAAARDHCAEGHLAVETPRPRGMPTAAEEMETMVQIGRFLQMWGGPWSYVFRNDVKLSLCGRTAGVTDANVRQALVDRFGGRRLAVGGKKCPRCGGKGWRGTGRPTCESCDGSGWEEPPGPLAGMTGSHQWAALGVACWWVDHGVEQHEIAGRAVQNRKPASKGSPSANPQSHKAGKARP